MREALLRYVVFLILFPTTVKLIAFLVELFHEIYLKWEINREVREKLKKR